LDGIACDGCGDSLLIEEDVRYVVKIEVFAAYDPLEITRSDLEKAGRAEMERLLEAMAGMDPKELEDGVYRKFQFDLCGKCQRLYLRDPLRFRPESASSGGGEA
jgi:hypothetical protein